MIDVTSIEVATTGPGYGELVNISLSKTVRFKIQTDGVLMSGEMEIDGEDRTFEEAGIYIMGKLKEIICSPSV